jgi:ATP-dependent DNA ligase
MAILFDLLTMSGTSVEDLDLYTNRKELEKLLADA